MYSTKYIKDKTKANRSLNRVIFIYLFIYLFIYFVYFSNSSLDCVLLMMRKISDTFKIKVRSRICSKVYLITCHNNSFPISLEIR